MRLGVLVAGLILMLQGGCSSEDPEPLPPGGDCTANAATPLSDDEVREVISRAVLEAQARSVRATVAVVNRQGDILGVFRMAGAVTLATIQEALPPTPFDGIGFPTELVAISKAGTGAFLSSCGNAFSTRTASFIIQSHFPPSVDFTAGGRLFGVQFSSLPCSDVNQLTLGLAGDAGGLPLYRNGVLVGGVGVEVDGSYGADLDPAVPDDAGPMNEESIALAATRDLETPAEIRADRIIVDGIRFPFVDAEMPQDRGASVNLAPPVGDFVNGFRIGPGSALGPFFIGSGGPSKLVNLSIQGLPVHGQEGIDEEDEAQEDCPQSIPVQTILYRSSSPIFPAGTPLFPARGTASDAGLTADNIETVLRQGICRAVTARAGIRQPLGSFVQVNITVVNAEGQIVGFLRTKDAPIFGIDVSAQKARSAAFMSNTQAATRLRNAGLGSYVDRLMAENTEPSLRLDGRVAYSDRGIGFFSQPFLPPGITGADPGPFSVPEAQFSPFNNGLEVDLVKDRLGAILAGFPRGDLSGIRPPCNDRVPQLANGLQIFAGAVPLYKRGVLVGAVGVSGDGIDQDDLVAFTGSKGFEAPEEMRLDQITIQRGDQEPVHPPYVKFPRNPNLGD